jgi:two-component system phosphate regulon response regulator OmpR
MNTLGNAPLSYDPLPHVLVVDDDVRICKLVSQYLRDHGFVAMMAHSAAEAREVLKSFQFDVLVVDVMMPGETGLEFTNALDMNPRVPVVLLTALGEVQDRIKGFESGADDYLVKPFEPQELVLRLQAILRRTFRHKTELKPFKIGRWQFDPDHEQITDGERVQKLTSGEANLLRALASQAGEVISREDLAVLCGVDAGERTIDVQVTRLRRKIEEDSKFPKYLQTIRGKGYLLRIEDL